MKTAVYIIISMVLCFPTASFADDANDDSKNRDLPVLAFPIRFFQTYLSGADGDRCTMHPSCSTYAVEAFREKGPFMGWIMTCDRLMRCGGDEAKNGNFILKNNKRFVFDPVRNNELK